MSDVYRDALSIVHDPGFNGGRAILEQSRVSLEAVVGLILSGESAEVVAQEFGLTKTTVQRLAHSPIAMPGFSADDREIIAASLSRHPRRELQAILNGRVVDRSASAAKAAHVSWFNTKDRSARTANARSALDQKFLDEADGDAELAAKLRTEHFARMGRRAAESRRRKREADAERVGERR